VEGERERERRTRGELEQQVTQLTAAEQGAREELAQRQAELESAQAEAQRRVTESQKEIKPRARRRIAKAEAAVTEAREEAKALGQVRGELEQQVTQLTAAEQSAQKALQQRDAELERMKRDAERRAGELANAERRILAAQETLAHAGRGAGGKAARDG
jgi:chromosome segregation ATPase